MKKAKKITIAVVFILILGLGTLSLAGPALGERISFDKLPPSLQAFVGQVIALNPAGPGEAPQYYDVLIKKTQTGSGSGAYKAGDIVTVRKTPAHWSSAERNNFWIVKMYLTPEQAQSLTEPLKKQVDSNKKGAPEEEMVSRRKHYIPPQAIKQLQEGEILPQGELQERE